MLLLLLRPRTMPQMGPSSTHFVCVRVCVRFARTEPGEDKCVRVCGTRINFACDYCVECVENGGLPAVRHGLTICERVFRKSV